MTSLMELRCDAPVTKRNKRDVGKTRCQSRAGSVERIDNAIVIKFTRDMRARFGIDYQTFDRLVDNLRADGHAETAHQRLNPHCQRGAVPREKGALVGVAEPRIRLSAHFVGRRTQ